MSLQRGAPPQNSKHLEVSFQFNGHLYNLLFSLCSKCWYLALGKSRTHSPPLPVNFHLPDKCKYINIHSFIVRLVELRESPLCHLVCFGAIILNSSNNPLHQFSPLFILCKNLCSKILYPYLVKSTLNECWQVMGPVVSQQSFIHPTNIY